MVIVTNSRRFLKWFFRGNLGELVKESCVLQPESIDESPLIIKRALVYYGGLMRINRTPTDRRGDEDVHFFHLSSFTLP